MDDDEQDPAASARERDHAHTERVEAVLAETESMLDEEHKYPMTHDEVAEEYGNQVIDLPNETETLGDVVDRLTVDRFERPAAVREAVLNELTGEEAGPEEYNDERPVEPLAEDTDAVESLEDEPPE